MLCITLLLTALCIGAEGNDHQQASPVEIQHIGTVMESITAGKYIYLKLEGEGKQTWIATYPSFIGTDVAKGDKVQYAGGVEMTDFKSTALDRTFDRILFITKITKIEAPRLTDFEHAPADNYHSQFVQQDKAQEITAPARGEIEKAAHGKSIEEIYSEADALKGSEVAVKAKVMKISKNILGKNWLTLQDGTGSSADMKLTATTKESVNAGDIVTVKGILKTDVNLGAGYMYKVIIEEASITK